MRSSWRALSPKTGVLIREGERGPRQAEEVYVTTEAERGATSSHEPRNAKDWEGPGREAPSGTPEGTGPADALISDSGTVVE